MAFKLSKDQVAERKELAKRLGEASSKLQSAVDEFNSKMDEIKGPVQAAIEEYNSVVTEVREFAEGIAAEADDDMSDKSDRWLESDRGQAAEAFKSEWSLSLDEIDIDLPDEISFDDPDY